MTFPDCVEGNLGYDAPTYRVFAIRLGIVPAPVDSYRVSVSGGPTAPGGADVGLLDGHQVGPGDVTYTGAWRPLDLENYPFLPDGKAVLSWMFETNEANSHDIATFTVEYRSYVPSL